MTPVRQSRCRRTVDGATLGQALQRNLSKWKPMSFVVVGLAVTIALIATILLFTDDVLDGLHRNELAVQDSGYPVATEREPEPVLAACYFAVDDGKGFGGNRYIAGSSFRPM